MARPRGLSVTRTKIVASASSVSALIAACSLTDTAGLSGGLPRADSTPDASSLEVDSASEAAAADGAAGGSKVDASGSRYAAAVLADAPLAYWRLGERTGLRCKDASGHGND